MIQENEIIMLLLGGGVFVFILRNYRWFIQIHAWKTILTGYSILLLAWVFTVLEGFFWWQFFNWSEHICYASSAVVMAIWCWQVMKDKKEVF